MKHRLCISYGKDSLACLGAIEKLGWELDEIVHTEIWATDTIQADLPEMIEFKAKADKIIKDRWGLDVKHIYARDKQGNKITYESIFYKLNKNKNHIYGFPCIKGVWCNSRLKVSPMKVADCIDYIGIAKDETERLARLDGISKISPLAEIGWEEKDCYKWCEENDLLSPIYKKVTRGGCWFCHNQSTSQLKLLRKEHPELWEILLKWDEDSPITFKPNHTLHDYDKRFKMEDEALIPLDRRFRWKMIEENNETDK